MTGALSDDERRALVDAAERRILSLRRRMPRRSLRWGARARAEIRMLRSAVCVLDPSRPAA